MSPAGGRQIRLLRGGGSASYRPLGRTRCALADRVGADDSPANAGRPRTKVADVPHVDVPQGNITGAFASV
jgi:hypothetical protein